MWENKFWFFKPIYLWYFVVTTLGHWYRWSHILCRGIIPFSWIWASSRTTLIDRVCQTLYQFLHLGIQKLTDSTSFPLGHSLWASKCHRWSLTALSHWRGHLKGLSLQNLLCSHVHHVTGMKPSAALQIRPYSCWMNTSVSTNTTAEELPV